MSNINELLLQQEKINKSIADELNKIGTTDQAKIIQDLETKNDKLALQVKDLESKLSNRTKEHRKYVSAYNEYMHEAKQNISEKLLERLAKLLQGNKEENIAKIKRMNGDLVRKLVRLNEQTVGLNDAYQKEVNAKIEAIRQDISKTQIAQIRQLESNTEQVMTLSSEMYDKVCDNVPPELELKQGIGVLSESKIALKAFSYIGVMFLFLSMVSLGYLSFTVMETMQIAVLTYCVPVILFVVSIYLSKRYEVLRLGLLGGSIGLLYIAGYLNYFILEVFEPLGLLIALIATTIISMIISTKKQKESLAIIAIVGAYLPLLANVTASLDVIMLSQVYAWFVTLIVVFLMYKYKWYNLLITGFALIVPWLFVFNYATDGTWLLNYVWSLVYFVSYSVIPLYTASKNHEGISSKISYIIYASTAIFVLTSFTYYEQSNHLINVTIQLVPILLNVALLMIIKLNNVQAPYLKLALRYCNMFILGILMMVYVPLNIETTMPIYIVSPIILSILYTELSIRTKDILYRIGSRIHILIAYAVLFYVLRFEGILLQSNVLFTTIGYLVLLAYFFRIYFHEQFDDLLNYVEYNVYYILNYIGSIMLVLSVVGLLDMFVETSMLSMLIIIIINYFAYKNDIFRQYFIDYVINIVLSFIIFIEVLGYGITEFFDIYSSFEIASILIYVGTIAAITFSNVYLMKEANKSESEVFYIAQIVYTTAALSIIFNTVYSNDARFILTGVYLLISAVLIERGFKFEMDMVRKFGLISSVLLIAKVFFFDIPATTTVTKIIAFFLFGIISLGISYIYQKMYNHYLEQKDLDV